MTEFNTDDLTQIVSLVYPGIRFYKHNAATIFSYLYNHPEPITPINLIKKLGDKAPSRTVAYKTLENLHRYGFLEKIIFKYPANWKNWFTHQKRWWLMDNYGTKNLNEVRYNHYRWNPAEFNKRLFQRCDNDQLYGLMKLLEAPVVVETLRVGYASMSEQETIQ